MKVFTTVREIQAWLDKERKKGKTIGLVPTMGALHEGHLSLVKLCREQADLTVLSIFVNPIQFGPQEDFQQYPRPLEKDLALAKANKVHAVFAPAGEEMYPPAFNTLVQVNEIIKLYCGASRPGHFSGVATVVLKLFNIVQPQVAVFGQKDAQQCAIIRQIIRDLNLALQLVIGPVIREKDGLALSSRNAYLSPAGRSKAVCLCQALQLTAELHAGGLKESAAIKKEVEKFLLKYPEFGREYFDLADANTFQPVPVITGNVLALIAGRIETTRLIDNMVISGEFK